MQWRRSRPALKWGGIRFLDAPEPLLAFVRTFRGETLLAVFNLGAAAMALPLPASGARVHDDHGLPGGCLEDGRVHLPGYSAFFADIDALQSADVQVAKAVAGA
jgi:alpha-glucosidase